MDEQWFSTIFRLMIFTQWGPKKVGTFFGSPPKAPMFSCTQRRAIRWSWKAENDRLWPPTWSSLTELVSIWNLYCMDFLWKYLHSSKIPRSTRPGPEFHSSPWISKGHDIATCHCRGSLGFWSCLAWCQKYLQSTPNHAYHLNQWDKMWDKPHFQCIFRVSSPKPTHKIQKPPQVTIIRSISDLKNLKRHGTKDIQAVIDGDQQGGTLLGAPEIHQAGAVVEVAGPIFKATSVYPN